MKPEDLDPTLVLTFLGFLAAFMAGVELSQMTTKRKPAWERDQPSRLKGALYSLAIVVVLVVGVWLAHRAEIIWP